MVKLSYKYGEMYGCMEMAAFLERETTKSMLKGAGAQIVLNHPENAQEVKIPNDNVLKVLQLAEGQMKYIPCTVTLPEGLDAVYEDDSCNKGYCLLFWANLHADILKKYAEITE